MDSKLAVKVLQTNSGLENRKIHEPVKRIFAWPTQSAEKLS